MKVRTTLAAIGTAFVLGTTGALALPAVAASAHSGTQTLRFISVTKKSIMLTKTSGAQQDTDVNAAGKTVGFDMLYLPAASAATGALNITVDTAGTLNLTGTDTISGGQLTVDSGELVIAAAASATLTGVTVDDDTTSSPGIDVSGTLVLDGGTIIEGGGTGNLGNARGTLTVEAGGTLDVEDAATGATLDAVNVTNNNLIEVGVSSTATLTLDDGTSISGGTVTLGSTGELLITAGAGTDGATARGATLTGVTVNAMALIAPGAFLWTTFQSQAALQRGSTSTAPEMSSSTWATQMTYAAPPSSCSIDTADATSSSTQRRRSRSGRLSRSSSTPGARFRRSTWSQRCCSRRRSFPECEIGGSAA